MNRRERLEQMGDKMKKFNNVYIKNFNEEIDDEKLQIWFERFGKIISAKVGVQKAEMIVNVTLWDFWRVYFWFSVTQWQ